MLNQVGQPPFTDDGMVLGRGSHQLGSGACDQLIQRAGHSITVAVLSRIAN